MKKSVKFEKKSEGQQEQENTKMQKCEEQLDFALLKRPI